MHCPFKDISVQQEIDDNDIFGFSSNKGIKICSHNVNRLEHKLDEIRQNLLYSKNAPDIFCCCETFLEINTPDNLLNINGYVLERKDRPLRAGGGLAVYFSNKIMFQRKSEFETSEIETMWFEIKPKFKKSWLLCLAYRPPNSLISWIDDFEKEISQAINYNSDVTILGDFNIDLLTPNKIPGKWKSLIETYNLHQLIQEPTRVTQNTSTLIDHIYVTNMDLVFNSHVSKYAISDHYPVCMTRNEKLNEKKNVHTTISYRNFKNFSENDFLSELGNAPFYEVEYESDPNACIQIWYNVFNKILNKHAPMVTKRVKRDKQPEWFNNEIKQARLKREQYHRLGMWEEYKYWRNKTQQIIDKSKKTFYSDMVKNSKASKDLWKCIQSLNPSYQEKPFELKKENGEKSQNMKEVCETFNDFFTSCVENLRNDNSTKNTNHTKLKQFIDKKLSDKDEPKFSIPPITITELFDEMMKLDINKSTGLDNIGPKILKLSAPYIVAPLTYIFNRSIDTGIFPNVLKNAKVTPVFKAGEKDMATNYRPISVIPTIAKLFEKHVSTHLYRYLSKYEVLHQSQSGFRQNHSCQTALINIVDKWLQEMNDGNINLSVLLDFKKAFDTVDHDILCRKLIIYGFSDVSVSFFKSYLKNRTQQVQIGNTCSNKMSIKYGVPQGSTLGPLLFILYINDLPLYMKNCCFDLYADDSTMHLSGKCFQTLQSLVQEDLNNVEQWCGDNNMFINPNKTKYMVIGTKNKVAPYYNESVLRIENEMIQISSCEKLLGIKIDPSLTWTSQIEVICSKISSRLYLLLKIKKFLNLDARKLFYNGYILPLIDYCCITWSGCHADDLERILKLQKRAARVILDTDPLTPSKPLFDKLGWMTVEQRIKYHKSILAFKCIKNDAPSYLVDKFNYISENNPYQLRNVIKGNLSVPKPKLELFKKSFMYSGPSLWNELPASVREAPNIHAFKYKIKNYLLGSSLE